MMKIIRKVVNDFCGFLFEVPPGFPFTLWNLQGVLRFANPGIPAEKKYCELLQIAAREGWVEPVLGQVDTYQKTKENRLTRARLRDLRRRLLSALKGNPIR